MLEDSANPHARRDGVAPMNADLLSLWSLRTANTGFRVVDNRAMVKNTCRKNGNCRETLSIRLCADIRRDRHLANVVLQATHHLAKRLNEDRHIDVFDVERFGF